MGKMKWGSRGGGGQLSVPLIAVLAVSCAGLDGTGAGGDSEVTLGDGGIVAAPPFSVMEPGRFSAAASLTAATKARTDALTASFSYPAVFAIVEGIVTDAEASIQPTPNQAYPEMIATRYTVHVIRSWKAKTDSDIYIWSYGGTLPEGVTLNGKYTREDFSGEAYLAVGQHVILAASPSYTLLPSKTKWHTLNGESGSLTVGSSPDVEASVRSFLDANYDEFTLDPAANSAQQAPHANDPVFVYTFYDKWCDAFTYGGELGVNINKQSFVDRGFDWETVDSHLRTAFSWWNDSQTDLKFHMGSYTTSIGYGNPGSVSAACCDFQDEHGPCEDTYFQEHYQAIAYVTRLFIPGCGITEWRMVFWANQLANDDEFCGTVGQNWQFEKDQSAPFSFFVVAAHEFGHVLGMGHDTQFAPWNALMQNGGDGTGNFVFSHQEVAGQTAAYGTEHGYLETVSAHYDPADNGQLTFGTVQSLTPTLARWKPVIDANNFSNANWPYALAWNELGTIHVAIGADYGDGSLYVATARDTGFVTENSFGMAVGLNNTIGLAWVDGTDPARPVKFAISYDAGSTWTVRDPGSVNSIGGVDLAFETTDYSWVMTWINPLAPREIGVATSTDSSGTYWNTPRTYMDGGTTDVDLVASNLAPAIECYWYDCLMVYRTFDDPLIRSIRQQAFGMDSTGLYTIPTSIQTADYGYSDLDVTALSIDDWLFTYVWPTTYEDALTYRIKDTGADGSFNYPRYKFMPAQSRSGFDVAYHQDSDTIRFLWHGR